MIRLIPLILILITFFSCRQSAYDQDPGKKEFTYESEKGNSVKITLPGGKLTSADNVLLTISIEYHQKFIPQMPDWNSLIDYFNILEIKDSPVRNHNEIMFLRNVSLLIDNLPPGDHLINPFEFKFQNSNSEIDRVKTDYIPIKIDSNLIEGRNDIIDEMQPWHSKKNYGIILAFLFLTLGVISIISYKIHDFNRKRKVSALNFHIPYKLRIEQCPTEDPVLFYSRLSAIIKEYLDHTLFLGVQSQTTEEFILMCRDSPLIEVWLQDQLYAFLKRADKISFDKNERDTEQIDGDIQFCLDFISHIDKKSQEENSL